MKAKELVRKHNLVDFLPTKKKKKKKKEKNDYRYLKRIQY